jgi:hypothetical protein
VRRRFAREELKVQTEVVSVLRRGAPIHQPTIGSKTVNGKVDVFDSEPTGIRALS